MSKITSVIRTVTFKAISTSALYYNIFRKHHNIFSQTSYNFFPHINVVLKICFIKFKKIIHSDIFIFYHKMMNAYQFAVILVICSRVTFAKSSSLNPSEPVVPLSIKFIRDNPNIWTGDNIIEYNSFF